MPLREVSGAYRTQAADLIGNPGQQAAYDSTGHCVVLAGPGSGKTKTLVLKLARILAEDVRAPRGAACITYSQECARELTRRLERLGLREAPNLFIGTVHGFCLRHLLMPYGRLADLPVDFPLRVATQRQGDQLLKRVGDRLFGAGHPYKAIDLGRHRRSVLDRGTVAWRSEEELAAWAEAYEAELRREGLIDYDDMVVFGQTLIAEHDWVLPLVQAKFPVLAVDEYQDLGVALDRIVRRLAFEGGVRLFAVGDFDQSIYGFTGADGGLLVALSERDDVERVQLQLNYRSASQIISASEMALGEARGYPRAIEVDLSEERLRRYFVEEVEHYRVRKEVRDLVLFAHHSAVKDPPFMRLNLITCRNLLIYLERELQQRLLAIFHYALQPGNYIFLGSAETADARNDLFFVLDRAARIYSAKPRSDNAVELLGRFPAEPFKENSTFRAEPRREHSPGGAHAGALEKLSPPSALVDEDHRIVNLSPNAGRFILPPEGPMSRELPDVVRPELRAELRSALHRAFAVREPTLTLPVNVAFNGNRHRVIMHVSAAMEHDREAPLVLVTFMDGGPVAEIGDASEDEATVGSAEVRRLREELRTAQERLSASRREHEAAIQEARISNEELQSVNEEYRSTAEELETSKEELQSINEELQTVNSELKSKLDNIANAHSDLQNLVNATEIGTLFLDPDLRIKMLTPAVEKLFSVTDSDVGRPITDFTHKLAYDRVEQDAREVLKNLTPLEREVPTKDDRWLAMRLRPYRTVEDRIDGVVLTFVEISEHRAAVDAQKRSETRYRDLCEQLMNEAISSGADPKIIEAARERFEAELEK